METTKEPNNAGMKPSTSKPSMNEAANMNISALRTKANNPKVMRVIGKVRTNNIGRTTKFNNPRIKAAIKAM